MTVVKIYLVSLFIVFLHFGVQITYWTDPGNRYFYGWREFNGIVLILDLLLIALVVALLAIGAKQLTQRFKLLRIERVLDHLLPLALVSGLLSVTSRYFVADHPRLIPVIWMTAMLAIGFSLAWQRSPLVKYASWFCLVFSPVPFILSAQVLTWGSWYDAPRTDTPVVAADTPKTPVFLFIFDEWSYQRSTRSGEFRPLFKNVRDFCNQSIQFSEARSPGVNTHVSIPQLIYQNSLELDCREGVAYWKDGRQEVLSTTVPSLFQLAKEEGYNSYLLGWRVPFNRILGSQIDYCRIRCGDLRADTLGNETVLAILRNVPLWTDPLSEKVSQAVVGSMWCRHCYDSATAARDEMFAIIRCCPSNTFALFHVHHPHKPHVFKPDGSYYGPVVHPKAQDYERSLLYLDFLFGQVVEHLRAAKKYDDALIIVTSDHSFRLEPEPTFRESPPGPEPPEGPDWKRRVPLIIKLPGQRSGVMIDDKICTNQLKPLFEAVFSGERDTDQLIELVEKLAAEANKQEPAQSKSAGSPL